MNKRILIVDDNDMSRKMAAYILGKEYEVEMAGSGMECLAYLERQLPDMILLDIEMPGMNGYEVLERLKENAETAAVPVVCATGAEDAASADKACDLGAAGYVKKPFIPGKLLAAIAEACDREVRQ